MERPFLFHWVEVLKDTSPVHQALLTPAQVSCLECYRILCGQLFCIELKDCKSWLEAGSRTSGVYTINPDEQTPFEVRGNI